MSTNYYQMPWNEVFDRMRERILGPLRDFPDARRVFGVPRGGAVVAGLTGRPTDVVADAVLIVDDIIDSGRTRDRMADAFPGMPFHALVDKTGPDADLRGTWVVFPWEQIDAGADLEDTVIRQLEFIGEDPDREGLKDTPRRVVAALREMTSGYGVDTTELLQVTFPRDGMDELIAVRDVPFWSLCEHHLLPFHGTVTVGYIPTNRIVGLSKLVRVIRAYARRLQVQERLTVEIGQAIEKALEPLGVGVLITAQHTCMQMRGVQAAGSMATQYLAGRFRDDPKARAEFLALAR